MTYSSRKLPGWLGLGALAMAALTAVPLYAQQNRLSFDQLKSNQTVSGNLDDQTVIVRKSAFSSAKPLPAPAPGPGTPFNWRGYYVGVHFGYGWGKADTRFTPLPDPPTFFDLAPTTVRNRPRGYLGGVQAGHNWQRGRFVFGGEADFTWSRMNRTTTVSPIIRNNGSAFPGSGFLRTSQRTLWFGTVRHRAGWTFGNVLIYGTGGLAYGRVRYAANSDFRTAGTRQYPAGLVRTKVGWTVGAGFEVGFRRSHRTWWGIKSKYLYYDLGNTTATADPIPPVFAPLPPFQVRYDWQTKAHIYLVGVNLHF